MPKDELTIWLEDAYDQLRTARMNMKYYGRRLTFWRRFSVWADAFVAVFTSGVVASWAVWREMPGLWSAFAALAAVASLIRPFLKLQDRIKDYATLYSTYRTIDLRLEHTIRDVRREGEVSWKADRAFAEMADLQLGLSQQEESHPNRKLLQHVQDEVDQELPPESLWLPAPKQEALGAPSPDPTPLP